MAEHVDDPAPSPLLIAQVLLFALVTALITEGKRAIVSAWCFINNSIHGWTRAVVRARVPNRGLPASVWPHREGDQACGEDEGGRVDQLDRQQEGQEGGAGRAAA